MLPQNGPGQAERAAAQLWEQAVGNRLLALGTNDILDPVAQPPACGGTAPLSQVLLQPVCSLQRGGCSSHPTRAHWHPGLCSDSRVLCGITGDCHSPRCHIPLLSPLCLASFLRGKRLVRGEGLNLH